MLTSVRIPRRLENSFSTFLKLGARRYLVISIVMVAATLRTNARGIVEEALLCVGSCSAKALRLTELEDSLIGKPLNANLRNAVKTSHFSDLSPIDDVRATAAYRREAAVTLVQRALDTCAQKALTA